MKVNTLHTEYTNNRHKWDRMRDVIAGRDALTSRDMQTTGGMYVKQLTNQTPNEYRAYSNRASFFGATSRTVDALVGMMFSKPLELELPAALQQYMDDITQTGQSLHEFATLLAYEEVSVTRVGVMVDYPALDTSTLTRAEAESLGVRPYLRMYKAETIINWKTTTINGREVISQVVLAESVEVEKNEFQTESKAQYRVLDLFDGAYRQRVFSDTGDVVSETFPRMNGQVMREIPFYVVGGLGVRKPLLLDLADLNIDHYRNSADYEHGLHFVGLPTPVVSGVQLDQNVKLQIGSTSAWVFSNPDAKASFLEFTGQGLGSIKEAMTDKEQRMAALGAKMLYDNKKAAESTETVSIKTAGERSILASTAKDISDTMTKALQTMANWLGANGLVDYSINTDYESGKLDPTMIRELVAAYNNDVITLNTLLQNLQRGEIIGDRENLDDYAEALTQTASRLE